LYAAFLGGFRFMHALFQAFFAEHIANEDLVTIDKEQLG